MALGRQTEPLHLIAERLQQPELRKVVARPGVNEAFRVTAYRHDPDAPDSVATLQVERGGICSLAVVYDKAGTPVQYDFAMTPERYQNLLAELRQHKFDTLDDQSQLPYFGIDLWLLERAAGHFFHDVLLSPNAASGLHVELIRAVKTHLPEAVRALVV